MLRKILRRLPQYLPGWPGTKNHWRKAGYLMTCHDEDWSRVWGKITGFDHDLFFGVDYPSWGVSIVFFGTYPPDFIRGIRMKDLFWRVLVESGFDAIVCLHCALPKPVWISRPGIYRQPADMILQLSWGGDLTELLRPCTIVYYRRNTCKADFQWILIFDTWLWLDSIIDNNDASWCIR